MKKLSILICLIISSFTVLAQYKVKTVKRPDGITLNYFNPIPVARANNWDAGLSLYKNPDNNTYFVAISVVFKNAVAKELNGNLLIQTTGKNGISLEPIYNRLVTMNGREVAASMYYLTERDINELKSNPTKLISFNLNDEIIALNLTENRDVLIKEFSILSNIRVLKTQTKGLDSLKQAKKEELRHKAFLQNTGKLKITQDSNYNKLKISSGQYLKNTSIGESEKDKNINLETEIIADDIEGSIIHNRSDKAIDKYKNYKLFGLMLLFGLIFFVMFRFNNKGVRVNKKTNKVKSQNASINNSLREKQFLEFTDIERRELMLKYAIDLDSGKNVITERILTNKKLRFDGLYIGSQRFTNRFTQELNTYIAIFKFNENGLVIFTDYTEENINIKINLNMLRELKKELSKVEIYEPFEGIAKYESFQNDTIKMKFFEQNHRNNEIDEDKFFSWYGKILNEKLILSRNESFFSYDKNSVVVGTAFNDIEFAFLNLK
ncbi:hypothetical protein [Flavobacterium nackdongense]|uniref:Uncharacterized protein n=1 Tax=Flavobacterium nackdongense TaxID=2547394 RepID=A0A4P6Y9S0_9FLAO|nr:hypothetical protein [Flavobacterium nackdongense]QBN19756.1 hypothetical protein E1750_13400 [Flavobacterium nackdongense]